MLANTLTLTINAVAKVLTRINQDNYGSEYRLVSTSERITLKIRHSAQGLKGTASYFDQHNVLVEWIQIPAAPATPVTMTVSTTLRGQFGSDPANLDYLSDALGVLVAAQLAAIVQGDS
jgi:hypothetical protein